MLGCPECEFDVCGKHFPANWEGHQGRKAEVTIVNAVMGTEIASVIIDVEMAVSMLKNLAEEPTSTPSKYQRLTLEGDIDVLDDVSTLKSLLPPVVDEERDVNLRIHLTRIVPDTFALLKSCASPACDALTVRYILEACPDCAKRMNLRHNLLAAINNGEYEEYSALVIAASQGHSDACAELCRNARYKDALNSMGQNGSTDLHVGASFNFMTPHVPLCQMLLDAHNFTNATARDRWGNTAVDVAKLRGHNLLASTIERHHSFKVGYCNVHNPPRDTI